MRGAERPLLLILTQVYPPGPAAVGQHLADAAAELVRRGLRVQVITAANGYDDPTERYPAHEVRDGVEIRRLPLSSFGKSSIAVRLAAQGLFVAQALAHAALLPELAAVLVSTSPPFCGAAGAVLGALRGVPLTYWLMDLNPDQMVALGHTREGSLPARAFDALNRVTLRGAARVVVLDRFMRERVLHKLPVGDKITVLPPWPPSDEIGDLPHADNPFRARHGLGDRFVVMYSGNHSPANPLTTLLDAAARLAGDPRFVFVFVGGGGGKAEIEARLRAGARNLVSLPYEPLAALRASLSAADVHVVSVGDEVVGIVHPCKAYGAMAVSRPLLVFGPRPSHLADLVDRYQVGRQVRHGDVDGAVAALRELAALPAAERTAMGRRGAGAIAGELGRSSLLGRFCDIVESTLGGPPSAAAPAP
jgi:glycosyltransferase involved in cell wall biosynthesis